MANEVTGTGKPKEPLKARKSWQALVDIVKPQVVRVLTPRGRGTGFLLYNSKSKGFCAIATASHVVNYAHLWEEPIRLQHAASDNSIMLRPTNRAVILNSEKDVAAVIFPQDGDFKLPDDPLTLSPSNMFVRVGVEIGWLGFPAISHHLCFFSGRVSAYDSSEERYLVDGVAINGVSGGPAFTPETDGTLSVVGVLSAYIPNRATGETLPGLAVVTDVVEFHEMVARFKSVEEAQSQQTSGADVPSAPPSEPPVPPTVAE
jgi:hypothetical protein